mgnify:FL=1
MYEIYEHKIEYIACPPKTLHKVKNATIGYWFCQMWHCNLWSNRYEIYEHKNEYVACPPIMLRVAEQIVIAKKVVVCCHNGKTYDLLVSLHDNGKRKFAIRNAKWSTSTMQLQHVYYHHHLSWNKVLAFERNAECHLEINCVSKPPVFYFKKMVILFLFMCSVYSQ